MKLLLDKRRDPCYTDHMNNKPQPNNTLRIDKRKLRSEMVLKGVTVQEIAAMLGMTRQAIYGIMNGQNTTLDTVSAIASALGVNPMSILMIEDDV